MVEILTGSTIEIPTEYVLHSAYPNPFNPITTISFGLPQDSKITLNVYYIEGRQVTNLINGLEVAGNHTLEWNAEGFPSGVYFVKMTAGDFSQSQKLMLVK